MMGADFEKVPIVEVTTGNFKEVWPSLKLSIDASLFIAIDCVRHSLESRNTRSILHFLIPRNSVVWVTEGN